jgi:GxxExxY protein
VADVEVIATAVIDCGYHLHRRLGPGLLETVYEAVLAEQVGRRGFAVERQKSVPLEIDGISFNEGFRVDLLVEGALVIELKSVERTSPVHAKQLLTYLRLLDLPLGLLMNFGAETFRDGLKRVVNSHEPFAPSRLRVRPDHLNTLTEPH